MKMQILSYNGFPVFVLENEKDAGKIKQLIFPKEVFYDIWQKELFVKCDSGLIPFSDLRLPTTLDSWIWETYQKEDLPVIEFDSRIFFKVGN